MQNCKNSILVIRARFILLLNRTDQMGLFNRDYNWARFTLLITIIFKNKFRRFSASNNFVLLIVCDKSWYACIEYAYCYKYVNIYTYISGDEINFVLSKIIIYCVLFYVNYFHDWFFLMLFRAGYFSKTNSSFELQLHLMILIKVEW